jgi:hypothetical protein
MVGMKRRVIHVHARNDEWVRVHRGGFGASCGWEGLLIKVGVSVVAFFVVCLIIKMLLPYLVLAAVGLGFCFFLRFLK